MLIRPTHVFPFILSDSANVWPFFLSVFRFSFFISFSSAKDLSLPPLVCCGLPLIQALISDSVITRRFRFPPLCTSLLPLPQLSFSLFPHFYRFDSPHTDYRPPHSPLSLVSFDRVRCVSSHSLSFSLYFNRSLLDLSVVTSVCRFCSAHDRIYSLDLFFVLITQCLSTFVLIVQRIASVCLFLAVLIRCVCVMCAAFCCIRST